MEKEKSTNTAIRIKPSLKATLEKAARERGMTFTAFLLGGARLLMEFDPEFLKQAEERAEKIKQDAYKSILRGQVP